MNPGAITRPVQSMTIPVVRSGRSEMRAILPARMRRCAGRGARRAVHEQPALQEEIGLLLLILPGRHASIDTRSRELTAPAERAWWKAMVVVVGAVGIDLIAVRERFLDGTSNPSDIRLGLGGVGWRIFSGLEVPRRFITALAGDPISRYAREAMEEMGAVAIQEISDREARPPLYLALMESGSLKVAASDFRIVERSLDIGFVRRHAGRLAGDDFLVLDANLSASLAASLVDEYATVTRVVIEPVSVEKASPACRRDARAVPSDPDDRGKGGDRPGGDAALARFREGARRSSATWW